MSYWKSLPNHVLRRFGYELRRRVPGRAAPFDVLGLLIERAAAKSPEAVRLLQIGAFDGVSGDPLHEAIQRHGLRGVLVEPLPDAFARLAERYSGSPRIRLENSAVAASDGSVRFYRVRQGAPVPDWAHQLAGFSRSNIVATAGAWIRNHIQEMSVPAVTVSTLLRRHGLDSVDVIQIDAEGFDFEIVKMTFEAGLRPWILNYERVHLSASDQALCQSALLSHGYRFIQVGRDTLAVRGDFMEMVLREGA